MVQAILFLKALETRLPGCILSLRMPPTTNQNHEQRARDEIDAQLTAAGWSVQDKTGIDFTVGEGQAIREYNTDTGPADYVLFLGQGNPVGVVEAKKEDLGQNITTVEEQVSEYAAAKLKYIQKSGQPLPFLYIATGVLTLFTDQRDPKPRSRELFAFHRPESLRKLLTEPDSLRARLKKLPPLNPSGLRECQIDAITKLEQSFAQARPRALIHMATGSGKTFTAITAIYRLLKEPVRAKRILFLVDTKNLGEQAEQEFMAYTPNDDNRTFTELHPVQRLTSSHIPTDAEVCISTIQRMYSILQGKELDESAEDENPNESRPKRKDPWPVVYNERIPPEFFDAIIIDECHRSIYNLWKQVLDYFDAFFVGLTATPETNTYGFFHSNLVSEYSHEDAVADGVNVQGEIFTIETEVTKQGGKVLKGLVEKREKLTRRKRFEREDDDQVYASPKLDREVVNPDQIRTIIRTFRDELSTIFPDRQDAEGKQEAPKTLIFAKSDSHADDIIQIVREEFGEGNDFCKKVTYKADENPKSVLAAFRNDYYPRIAVTVDMIATGTDVKPLECLLFMRDVKSRGYFEQMKGRGTRTLDHDALKKASPAAKTAKTHYVIVDAVGVTKSCKTASRPPITKPSVAFKDIAMEVVMGSTDIDTVSTLAGRLARIDRQLTPEQRDQVAQKMGGATIADLTKKLFHAIDGDAIETRALEIAGQPEGTNPGDDAREKAQDQLVTEAAKPLTGAVVTDIIEICNANLQTIDHDTMDRLLRAEWDADAREKSAEFAADFETFCQTHKDELDALTIYYDQPQRRQEVTLQQIKDLLAALRANAPRLAPLRVWEAYAALDEIAENAAPATELTALVALLRRVTGLDEKLSPFSDTVRRNFRDWILEQNAGQPLTEAQTAWLKQIRDHIATSFRLEAEDLEYAPFDGKGGPAKMRQLFGARYLEVVDELNGRLVA